MVNVENKLVELVELAARQQRLSGLTNILRFIGESSEAVACILWQAVPTYEASSEGEGSLQVVAYWVRDYADYGFETLPFNSLTGAATKRGQTLIVGLRDPRVRQDQFLQHQGLKEMCSIPVRLPESVFAALNLYWATENKSRTSTVEAAEKFARALPPLYSSIRERGAFSLVGRVRDLIEIPANDESSASIVIDQFCRLLSDHFSCLETSVFFENRLENPGRFQLCGSTCREYIRRNSYAISDEGLTAWVLRNKKTIRINDVIQIDRYKANIQREYPGLSWGMSSNLGNVTRLVLGLSDAERLPPLSFVAAPVLAGENILGVVRCCTCTRAPYSFSSADIELLRVLASQIGNFWSALLTRQEMKNEIASWHRFGVGIQSLTSLALAELDRPQPDHRKIYQEGLKIAAEVIQGADVLDVRLYDPATKALFYFVEHGSAWQEGISNEIMMRRAKRFSVSDGAPQSAGAWVFQTDKTRFIPDVNLDEFYQSSLAQVRRMIIAPISSPKQKYGVFDVCGMGPVDFPRHAPLMVTLLGQQLGLFHVLASAVGALHEALQVQAQSYEDLEHQLRNTIRQALERLSALVKETLPASRRAYTLQAVRGLISKAYSVVRNVAVFGALHRGVTLKTEPLLLTENILAKSLIAMCSDAESLWGPDSGIHAGVDRVSLSVLNMYSVEADLDLLEQALRNVVENAFKYSQPHTIIQVGGGIRDAHFYVSVRNRGITLSDSEACRVTERGWRGEFAKTITPYGSGIGLWLTDHIMKAHGGRLEVIPTNTQGITEFRLLLPASK